MRWLEVDLSGPLELEELLVACMESSGCSSLQVIREEDLPAFEGEWRLRKPTLPAVPNNIPRRVTVRGYFPPEEDPFGAVTGSLRRASESGIAVDELKLEHRIIEDPGWERSWKKHHRPSRIAGRFVVAPSWSRPRLKAGEIRLVVDPGMAFGTGQHATTRLCMQALAKVVRPGDRVIDVGCGSGILSIAAAALGARDVLALDTDRIATAFTRETARVNQWDQVVLVQEGTLSESHGPTDIVVTNILAPVIVGLLDTAARCLAGGRPPRSIIASGLVVSQEGDVTEAMGRNGFKVVEVSRSREWSCITANLGGGE